MGNEKNRIIELWQQLRTKNSFVQNSAYMFSASAWGIVLQFAFAPILSRIYDPEAYGLFGIFNSWVVVLGIFVTLAYSQAFILPEKESSFRALLRICLRSTFLMSLAVSVAFILFWEEINAAFNAEGLGRWTMFTGLVILLMALDRIMIDWSVRQKSFKRQSLVAIPVTLGTKGFNVAYGYWITNSVSGLLITHALTYLVRIFLYMTYVLRDFSKTLREKPSMEEFRSVRKEFRAYPTMVMWSNALNTASNYLPVVLLPVFLDSPRPAGLFTFALLVLDLPARLLGAGVSKVYLQKAVELKDNMPKLADATWKLYKTIVAGVLIPLLLLGLFGEEIYSIALGEEWSEAGLLAAIMGGYYFFRLTSAPISGIFNALREERGLLIFQTSLFLLRAISLVAACLITDDLIWIIVSFTIGNILAYLLMTIWIFVLLKKYVVRSLVLSLTTFSLSTLLVIWFRLFL